MKTRLDVQSVAAKQLESAIWMYAYNYDEVAVHTIAGAAFELFTKRLRQETILDDIHARLTNATFKKFIATWNKPYNFFKHGEHNRQPIECIDYDESQVEFMIYLSATANLQGPANFRLNCARIFVAYFNVKHASTFKDTETLERIDKAQKTHKPSTEELSTKEALRAWLGLINHSFVDGRDSPFRDID